MVQPQVALERSLNKEVIIHLKDQRVLQGLLVGFDEHMNIVLDHAEERSPDGGGRRLGILLLRGNNVITISSVD